jgi:hypothetical protein
MKWHRGKITWGVTELSGLILGNWILINRGEGDWALNHVPSTMRAWEGHGKQKQAKLHWERFFEKHPELLNLETENIQAIVQYRAEINQPIKEI